MNDQSARRYLVVIKLQGETAAARVGEAASGVQRVLTEFGGKPEVLTYSADGQTLLFLIRTKAWPKSILEKLNTSETDQFGKLISAPPIRGEDAVAVIEIGEEYSLQGLSRADPWLRRTPS